MRGEVKEEEEEAEANIPDSGIPETGKSSSPLGSSSESMDLTTSTGYSDTERVKVIIVICNSCKFVWEWLDSGPLKIKAPRISIQGESVRVRLFHASGQGLPHRLFTNRGTNLLPLSALQVENAPTILCSLGNCVDLTFFLEGTGSRLQGDGTEISPSGKQKQGVAISKVFFLSVNREVICLHTIYWALIYSGVVPEVSFYKLCQARGWHGAPSSNWVGRQGVCSLHLQVRPPPPHSRSGGSSELWLNKCCSGVSNMSSKSRLPPRTTRQRIRA